jgi:hypothetical protein
MTTGKSETSDLTETRSVEDALARGYSVVREVDDDGHLNAKNRAAAKEYRDRCAAMGAACVRLRRFHDQARWGIYVTLPAGSDQHAAVAELMGRFGDVAREEDDEFATCDLLRDRDAVALVSDLVSLLGLPAKA